MVEIGGPDAFRRFVNEFVWTFRYNNVGSEEFQRLASAFCGEFRRERRVEMEKLVASWLREPGIPQIEAIRTSGNKIVLMQVASIGRE